MKQLVFSLVNCSNGMIMTGVFALVVIILVAVLVTLINSGKKGDIQ